MILWPSPKENLPARFPAAQGIITFPFLKLCHALNILCTNLQCTTSRNKISFIFITQLGKLDRCSTLFSPLFTAGIYLCHSSLACSFQFLVLLTWVTNCSISASIATFIDHTHGRNSHRVLPQHHQICQGTYLSLWTVCWPRQERANRFKDHSYLHWSITCPCLHFARRDGKCTTGCGYTCFVIMHIISSIKGNAF